MGSILGEAGAVGVGHHDAHAQHPVLGFIGLVGGVLPDGHAARLDELLLDGLQRGMDVHAGGNREGVGPFECIDILHGAEIGVRDHGDGLVQRDLHPLGGFPLGIMDREHHLLGAVLHDFPGPVVRGREAQFPVDERGRSAAAQADRDLVAVLPAMVVVVVFVALGFIALVPLVGDELAGEFHPDVQAGGSGISLQRLAVKTAGDEVVLEDEIVGPLWNEAGHHFLLLGAGAQGGRRREEDEDPFHAISGLWWRTSPCRCSRRSRRTCPR